MRSYFANGDQLLPTEQLRVSFSALARRGVALADAELTDVLVFNPPQMKPADVCGLLSAPLR